MHEPAQSPVQANGQPILAEAEVSRRMLLLTELQAALAADGVRCVLARNHRLVLQYNAIPCHPSGLINPQLHIFAPDGTDIATTDGKTYSLASGGQCPADDPAAVVTLIRHGQHARTLTAAAHQKYPTRPTQGR